MEPRYLSEAEARELARAALAMSSRRRGAGQHQQRGGEQHPLRGNQITTSGDAQNASLTVSSAFGRRIGSATTNRFDDESLRRVVEMSERLARLAPEDPEYLGELGEQQYPEVEHPWFEATANLDAERGRRRCRRSRGWRSSAGSSRPASCRCGPARRRSRPRAGCSPTTAPPAPPSAPPCARRTAPAPGGRAPAHFDWAGSTSRELAERAVEKAEMSRNPQPIEPGR
jgi:predicted Zn-dependent protease